MAETRGTTTLRAAGVEHRLLRYRHSGAGAAAEEAARELGVDPERMLKSLVARAGARDVFALVPATGELSLKKLATAAGEKTARMAEPRDAERLTGYQVGGISPLGSRLALPVFVDASVRRFEHVCVNAGGRGLIVELPTADLVTLTGAVTADLAAQS
jgi:Cys-tRNA(Pro)/Cys-tRNA(Cys) deacylase